MGGQAATPLLHLFVWIHSKHWLIEMFEKQRQVLTSSKEILQKNDASIYMSKQPVPLPVTRCLIYCRKSHKKQDWPSVWQPWSASLLIMLKCVCQLLACSCNCRFSPRDSRSRGWCNFHYMLVCVILVFPTLFFLRTQLGPGLTLSKHSRRQFRTKIQD